MWDVGDMGNSLCRMFNSGMLTMWVILDVRCRGFGILGMCDVQDVE